MPYTTPTKPSVGDPTKKSLADALIDNDTFLYGLILSAVGNREIILNGSFETDADGDSYPDGWTRTLYTGGSFTWDNSTSAADGKAYHGKRSAKFTSPGGGGNGGGYITSESFFEVTEGRPYKIQFATKSSVADVHNKGQISFYDCTQALISTTTFWDDAAANPTSWTLKDFWVKPPANARYAKLIFHGCVDDDTTAGSTWFDDIRIAGYMPAFRNRVAVDVAGSYRWTCPAGVFVIELTVIGGGGGAGSVSAASGGGGGGGTAYVRAVSVTPGTVYAFTVGAGGAGATGGAGSAGTGGGNSTMTISGTTYTGSGGSGGGSGGAGGAGGAASNGDVNTTGETGETGGTTPNVGGYGGAAVPFGVGTAGGLNNAEGVNGPGWGSGGSGHGAGTGSIGGNGAAGVVLIRF